METLVLTMALSLTFVGCSSFYLSSPRQGWRAAPLPAKPARAVGVFASLGGFFAFARTMDLVPATFTFITSMMLAFVVLPYLGAAFSAPRKGS